MLKKDVLRLIKQRETESIELKSSLSKLEEIVEAISGFSNTKGGKILIGVSNNGKILGVKIGKDTVERLTNKIAQNTDPKVQPRISIQEIDKKKIIVIDVKEGVDKLVLAFGRPYKRVGKSTVRMSKDEYERLILEKHKEKLRFDNQICEGASYDDIDENTVNWFIERYEFLIGRKLHLSGAELVKSFGCLAKIDEEVRLTNVGVLLFGKDPQKFYPNSRVTVVIYPGRSIGTKHIDLRDFEGTLFKIIDDVDDFTKKNIHAYSYLKKKQVPRESIPQYPYFVIRELLVNAVAHRDYNLSGARAIIKIFEDRIEYQSPGPLPKGITPENITKEVYHRNPILMKALSKVKYVEEIGEGWDRIIEEIKNHPLKPKAPKIEDTGLSVIVTIYSPEKLELMGMDLNERQKKIIKFIEENKRMTTSQCAHLLNVSNDTALRELLKLRSLGLVGQKGVGRGTYYTIK